MKLEINNFFMNYCMNFSYIMLMEIKTKLTMNLKKYLKCSILTSLTALLGAKFI